MAQDAVNNILQGLQIAHQRRAEKARTEIERQRLELQRQGQEDEIKIRHDTMDQNKKHQDAILELSKKAAEIQHMVAKQDIAAKIMKGEGVPGETVSPAAQTGGGAGFTPMDQSKATSLVHTLPTGDQITLPTPEAHAAEQAKLFEITNKPKEEALRREKKAEEEARFDQAERSKQYDYVRTMQAKIYDDERAKRQQAAEDERAKLHAKTSIDVAKIMAASRNQGGGLPENFDLQQFTDDVLNGNVSKEDIPKLLGKQAGNVQLALANSGIRPLSKKQQEVVGDYKGLTNIIDLMDQVIANQSQTHNPVSAAIGGLLTSGNQNLTAPEAELNGRLSVIAKGLMKETGNPSNKDMDRAKGLVPSRWRPLETNIKKRDDFIKELDSVIDAKLATIPQTQRELIKKKLGLDKYKQMGGQPAAPSAATPSAAPGATHVWTPQGIQPIQQQQR